MIKKRRSMDSILESVPAPIGGWNARDPIGAMDKTEAVDLENIFPTPADVMLRQGQTVSVSVILQGEVRALMAYSAPSGTQALYAAAGDAIYNCSSSTATASSAVSGFSNANWQHTNFTNTDGTSYLLMVNGADGYWSFNGSAWAEIVLASATASEFSTMMQHKQRLWFGKSGTLETWYLGTDAVSGSADLLDLSAFARKGGSITALATWTLDAGDGIDDLWIAATSEGEIIVYKGTDPTSSSTWSMIGRFELGRPLGKRCFVKFGADLLYLAEDGVWPISAALLAGQTQSRIALTDKIQDSFKVAATNYFSSTGWQILFWPKGTMVLVNIPVASGSQQQYVMNSISGAWCRFTGVKANCFEIYGGNLYFGGNGYVSRFWTTFADDSVAITGNAKQAFHYFKHGGLKQFTLARPILQSNGTPSISFGLNVDYSDTDILDTLTFSSTSYGVWDTGLWDSAVWGGNLDVQKNWAGVNALGICAAPRMRIQASGIEVHWQATDLLYKPGAII